MVSSEDQGLDEVILQVFEEHEESFHFPVATQKEARAFVKALHGKGLSYDCLLQEIKELEQNFSAWRKGISRPGIGNRVIERINRPLQEILLSDGEEEDPDYLDQLSTDSDEIESNYSGTEMKNNGENRLAANFKSIVQETGNGMDSQKHGKGDTSSGNASVGSCVKENNFESLGNSSHEVCDKTIGVKEDLSGKAETVKDKVKDDEAQKEVPQSKHGSIIAENETIAVNIGKSLEINEKKQEAQTATKPEAVVEKKLAVTENQQAAVTENKHEATDKKKEAVVEKKQGAVTENKQAGVTENKQEAADKKKEAVVENKQGAVTENKQAGVTENKQEAADKKKEAVTEKKQAVTENRQEVISVTDNKLEAVVDKKLETVVENKQAVIEKKPGALAENKTGALAENKQGAVTDKQEPVADVKQGVVTEKKQETVKENKQAVAEIKQAVVTEKKQADKDEAVKENKQETVTEKKQDVVTLDKQEVVTEKKEIAALTHSQKTAQPMDVKSKEVDLKSSIAVVKEEVQDQGVNRENKSAESFTGEKCESECSKKEIAGIAEQCKSEPPTKLIKIGEVTLKEAPNTSDTSEKKLEDEEVSVIESVGSSEVFAHTGNSESDSKVVEHKIVNVHAEPLNQEHLPEKIKANESKLDFSSGTDAESEKVKLEKLQGHPSTLTGRCQGNSSDIQESYDSDFDDELNHDSKYGVNCKSDEPGKPQMSNESQVDDSVGYVYVFTDSPAEKGEFRMKVGASRFPHKKLQQSLLFNIDMKLVSAVQVSDRRRALLAVHQKLNVFSIPETIGWFCGPLESILNVLMAVAKDYPHQD